MASASVLPPPPYKSPMVTSDGLITDPWQKWLIQLYQRVGGINAVSNVNLQKTAAAGILTNTHVGSTNTTVYTSPTGLSTIIDSFTAKNIGNIDQTLSIYLVPVGSTPQPSGALSNIVVSNLSVPAGQTITVTALQSQIIGSGAYISCVASSAGQIIAFSSGRTVS